MLYKAVTETKRRIGWNPAKPLHWKNLNHEKKRVYVQELASRPLVGVVVVSCKERIPDASRLRKPPWLYNYTARYLVERVSWYVSEQSGRCTLVLSNRANTKYQALQSYISQLIGDPKTEVKQVIDLPIVSRNMAQVKLLQAADALAGAAFNGLDDGNRFGIYEDRYIMDLGHKLYCRRGNLLSYGLKLLCRQHEIDEIIRARPWIRDLANKRVADPGL